MFCAPGPVFGGNEGDETRFHVLRARSHFWRYRGRRVPFSCSARPGSFSAVSRESGPVFKFYVPGHVFAGTEGDVSRFRVLRVRTCFWRTEGVGTLFNVLCARTRFRRYQGRRVPFSSFARLDSFSSVPRASGPVLVFCALGLVFGGTEGDESRFDVLRARTRFRRY
jgi:hypothetical protein